jgi:predicted NAD-dependent protein-ADP-ribosyltransferase YbiA (DUF1768 family)
MDFIEIDKTLIPYRFEIKLSDKIYTFYINYNCFFDFFTADLILNGTTLVTAEKLVLNEFLFRDVFEDEEHNLNPNAPQELLFVGSNDNSVKRVSYDNLGETVFLYVVDRTEVLE